MKMDNISTSTWPTPFGHTVNVRHLRAHVLVQLSYVSEHALTNLVWWVSGCAPMGVCPGFLFTAQHDLLSDEFSLHVIVRRNRLAIRLFSRNRTLPLVGHVRRAAGRRRVLPGLFFCPPFYTLSPGPVLMAMSYSRVRPPRIVGNRSLNIVLS
jgi:hypothetical protein